MFLWFLGSVKLQMFQWVMVWGWAVLRSGMELSEVLGLGADVALQMYF